MDDELVLAVAELVEALEGEVGGGLETEEEIEEAIRHLKEAAKKFHCPICRALHLHLAEFSLRYDLKKKLKEKGLSEEEVKKEFKRYEPEIRERIERLREELKVEEDTYKKGKEKFTDIALKSLGGM